MRRHRVTALMRRLLVAVVLSGLFAMHGAGTGHHTPTASAMPMHVTSNDHAHAMAPESMAALPTPVGDYVNAGAIATHAGMGMDACVAILTAAALLIALVAAACRRHDIDSVGARDPRAPTRPRRARPKPAAMTLAQLCVLRT